MRSFLMVALLCQVPGTEADFCVWQWSEAGSSWSKLEDCSSGCGDCAAPTVPGLVDGDFRETACDGCQGASAWGDVCEDDDGTQDNETTETSSGWWFVDLFSGGISLTLGLWRTLKKWARRALKEAWCWFIAGVISQVDELMQMLLSEWPEAGNTIATVTGYSEFIQEANYWFPISEGATILGAYYAFKLVYVFVKIVRRFIPTAG